MGQPIGGLFALIKFIFYIVCIVYFYMILDYVRFLINEKCKCSEDYRRGLIMAGSVIEIVILFLILLVIIILPVIFNSVSVIVKNMDGLEKEVSTAVRNPYESVKKIPSELKSASKMVSNIGKQSKKAFKKMTQPNTYGGFGKF
jgi:predicted PurR-regulated permease PerM